MSSADKIDFLRRARAVGYRIYLYYVATEDPMINVSRVQSRVQMGGHPVPEDKIIERYERSLSLLFEAIQETSRAYIFDNSKDTESSLLLAEITEGLEVDIRVEQLPQWFHRYIWERYEALAEIA